MCRRVPVLDTDAVFGADPCPMGDAMMPIERQHVLVEDGSNNLVAHFFLAGFTGSLPFCNFFRRFGNLVAGILAVRRSFLFIVRSPCVTCRPILPGGP